MKAEGLRSLEWLASVQRSAEGTFAPIGSNGFYEKAGAKASFDQQPVDDRKGQWLIYRELEEAK